MAWDVRSFVSKPAVQIIPFAEKFTRKRSNARLTWIFDVSSLIPVANFDPMLWWELSWKNFINTAWRSVGGRFSIASSSCGESSFHRGSRSAMPVSRVAAVSSVFVRHDSGCPKSSAMCRAVWWSHPRSSDSVVTTGGAPARRAKTVRVAFSASGESFNRRQATEKTRLM